MTGRRRRMMLAPTMRRRIKRMVDEISEASDTLAARRRGFILRLGQ